MGGECSTNGEVEEGVKVIGVKGRGKNTARKTKTILGWRGLMR
jgi:hypothetical protein